MVKDFKVALEREYPNLEAFGKVLLANGVVIVDFDGEKITTKNGIYYMVDSKIIREQREPNT